MLCDRRREQLYGITKAIEILDASLVRLFDVAVFEGSNIGWFLWKGERLVVVATYPARACDGGRLQKPPGSAVFSSPWSATLMAGVVFFLRILSQRKANSYHFNLSNKRRLSLTILGNSLSNFCKIAVNCITI